MIKVYIFHLSDLHIQQDSDYGQGTILNTLLRSLKDDLDKIPKGLESVLKFVVISGDLTRSGTKDEFESVKNYLKQIKDALGPKKLILSPGNHDLNWHDQCSYWEANKLMSAIIEDAADAENNIEREFKNNEGNRYLNFGMKNYYDFLNSKEIAQTYDSNFLYSIWSEEIGNIKLNFVSMNSAYLFSDRFPNYAYYGYIGKKQIETAYNKTWENSQERYNFNVAAFHHPFDAFPESVRVQSENKIKSCYNLVLTGHVHNMSLRSDHTYVRSTGNKVGGIYRATPTIISSARCVQDSGKSSANPGYLIIPGYSIIEINIDDKGIGSVNVHQKRQNKEGEWRNEPELDDPANVFVPRPLEPAIITNEWDVYLAGTEIMTQGTSNNLVVYQKTPSLILGKHAYCKCDRKVPESKDEENFMNILEEKIRSCSTNESESVLYLFDLRATRDAIKQCTECGDPINDKVCSKVRELKEMQNKSRRRFSFEPIVFETLGPFIFSDEGLMLYIGKRDRETLVFSSHSKNKNGDLFYRLKLNLTNNKTTTYNELVGSLGLSCQP